MGHSKVKIFGILVALMIFASGSAVMAATPNEQVVSAIGNSGLSGTYSGITGSFLRDTGKVLTQTQADAIIININSAVATRNAISGTPSEAQAWEIEKQFEAACTTAGFTVSDVSRLSDGGFAFTVSDPVSGKSFTAQANAVRVTWTASGATSTSTTMVAKTGVDNSLFAVTAVLALITLGAGMFVYRKNAIN
ncbi:hypothetical protein [Acetobacterium bakii]|uniref:Gram-positive cocci surface proteins LPxTG domain-containing protein n=1 Tax=Acetobacterium bakii TaxID=52689 RepID=A0A0L6U530_9FIRM|nr:hypothetical protein [Acetobacterium bakii]KNZ42885.1 hypothetical protein AKG39_03960 [Acetobacterium bakii]